MKNFLVMTDASMMQMAIDNKLSIAILADDNSLAAAIHEVYRDRVARYTMKGTIEIGGADFNVYEYHPVSRINLIKSK